MKKLLFPLIAAVIFISLLLALLMGGPVPGGQTFPLALGLLAFSLAITDVLIALRPKSTEKALGLPKMYAIHGSMAVVLCVAALIHAFAELGIEKSFTSAPAVMPAGFLALILLVLATFTGAFVLSGMFAGKLAIQKRIKKSVKRETGLWMHRLSVIAVLLIFGHMMAVDFVSENTALCALAGIYVLIAVGGYVVVKFSRRARKYVLKSCTQLNPEVYELSFAPESGEVMSYTPGQYLFVRFLKSDLPKESHPFSISCSTDSAKGLIQVMVKKSGDYTNRIGELKAGDIATLDGPYGSFFDSDTAKSETPMVLLAGGIGITPMLSIIRSLAKTAKRKLVLVWGLSTADDAVALDELGAIAKANPNFSLHITFSKESVPGYDRGRMNGDYLKKVGVDALYPTADFFICGPGPMMNSMKEILKENNVPAERTHIEEFSF